MKTNARRGLALLSLVASLVVWGCTEAGDPAQLLAPGDALYGKSSSGERLKLVARSETQVTGSATHYRVIDETGGVLGDAAYRIVVPEGAVSGPTLFVIGSSAEHASDVVIKATATSCPSADADVCYQGGDGLSNDVGSAGFRKPVQLHFGFSPGGGNKAWRGVTIVWIRPDGEFVRVPTTVLQAQKELRGLTNHFSLYGIGWP